MKTVYLNANFECSVTEKDDTIQNIQTDFFDNKCNTFIEGYRFIPQDQEWHKIENNVDYGVFKGEMITPFKDYQTLLNAQTQFEKQEYESAIDNLLLLL